MKALQNHTLVTPEVRQNAIIDFVNRINGIRIILCMLKFNVILCLKIIIVKISKFHI